MAWSRLQSKSATASVLTVGATFATNLSAGSKLVAFVVNAKTMTISTVKDTANNSFTQVNANSANTLSQGYIYVLDTPAGDVGATTTVTATFTGTANGCAILIMEMTGLATGSTAGAVLDGTAAENNGSTTWATAGTSVTVPAYSSAIANEFLTIILGDSGDAVGSTVDTPSGYTADANNTVSDSNDGIHVFYKNSTGGSESPASVTAHGGGNTFDWDNTFVAFKLAAAAAAAAVLPVRSRARSRVLNQYKPTYRPQLFVPPAAPGAPLTGIPDSPALLLASAVGANTIAGLAGLPVPALAVEATPGQQGLFGVIGAVAAPAGELEITPSLSGGTSLVGTPAPALILETAIAAAGLLGLTATPAPALELETSRPAAGLLGLTATPAPAVEPGTSLPAAGTLAVITALNGTPPPALALDITPALSGGGALIGTPAPAIELSKTQPAAGLLGLAGIPAPAVTVEAQRPATGIYALAGISSPAAALELGIPASGGSTVTGTPAAAIQLLGAVPAAATLAVPPPIVYGRARIHTGATADSEPGTGTPAAAYAHTGSAASATADAADPATAKAHTGKPADTTIRGDT